jgi:DNA-binding MarR family transcriptional regulator
MKRAPVTARRRRAATSSTTTTTATDPDPDSVRAMSTLRRIVRALRLHDKSAERLLGISVAQLFVLQLLEDGRPRSLSDLAGATLTDLSSVSAVVRRLVERGLVVRGVSSDDARRAALALTDEGRALLRRAPRAPQERLLGALRTLPKGQRAALADALGAVAEAMGAFEESFFFEEEDDVGRSVDRKRPPRRRAPR